MARLTIEQVKAPDFSGTAEILANAQAAFQAGMGSAKDLLGKYQEGKMVKGDNELAAELAALPDEAAFNAFIAKGGLNGRNISEEMRKSVLGFRDETIGFAQGRADVNSTTSATNRLNAAEGRTHADWVDGNNVRDERRSMNAAVVDATLEGRRFGEHGNENGSTGISQDNPVFNEFMGTVKAGGVTNPYALAAIAATGSHESGFSAKNAAGSWSDPSESGRPGTAGGVMSWNNERFDAMREFTGGDLSGAAQAKYFLAEDPALIAKLNNAKSADEAIALMNNAWRFAGYDRPGGEAGRRAATANELVGMFTSDDNRPITANPSNTSAFDNALADRLRGAKYLDPLQDTLPLLNTGRDAKVEGQGKINAAEAERVRQGSAAAILDAANNPLNRTPNAVGVDLAFNNPRNLPASAIAPTVAAGIASTDVGGALNGALTFGSSVDPNLAIAQNVRGNSEIDDFNSNPVTIAMRDVETFNTSEGGIGSALIDRVGGVDEALGIDAAYVDKEVARYAQMAGVTNQQMAATLAQMDENGTPIEDVITGNNPELDSLVIERAGQLFGAEAQEAFIIAQQDIQSKAAKREGENLTLSVEKKRAAQLPEGSQQRADAEEQIRLKTIALKAKENPTQTKRATEKYLSAIIGFDPSKFQIMTTTQKRQYETVINNDKSLNPEQRMLLILGLRL